MDTSLHEISHHYAIHDCYLKTTKDYSRIVASILFFWKHELFRTQPTRDENQEVVSHRHSHSRYVPVYKLRLNRDLPNSKLQNAEDLIYSAC
jgi:hypothetical protein